MGSMVKDRKWPPGSGSAKLETRFAVTGMSCANCARHVQEAIQSLPSVSTVDVDLAKKQATLRWKDAGAADIPAAVRAVEAAGFQAKEISPESKPDHHEEPSRGWEWNVWLGLAGFVPLICGEWIFGWDKQDWFRWFSFAAATIVQAFAGWPFYRGAWFQLKRGQSNMDALVALGSTTAYAYSVWGLFTGFSGHLYFTEAVAIISLISLGHAVEARVSHRASSALRALLRLAPETARLVQSDGTISEVPVSQLQPGDIVALRPGDRVPLDGQVVEGTSALDESMLTGESMPAAKNVGETVYAGTTNLNGKLHFEVKTSGDATALARIVEAVRRAQSSRAEIQRIGDRVSNVFVPIVIVIALASGLWWGLAPEPARQLHGFLAHWLWMAHVPAGTWGAGCIIAAAVLIVACPCAMGLATPAAIMAAANAASRHGILVRDGVALEKAGKIDRVVFDKTGTLTRGKPAVAEFWLPPGHSTSASTVRGIAKALAEHSSHPLSHAIAQFCGVEPAVPLNQWREIAGSGLHANLNSTVSVALGSLPWLKESRKLSLADAEHFIQQWSDQGASLVGLSIGQDLAAVFACIDPLKEGAPELIHKLKNYGWEVYLLTGDHRLTAQSVAAQVGIPQYHVFSEVRPEQKAAEIENLRRGGKRVAFIGDGINDAPALAQADLAIAVTRASDIARETADIVLLKADIQTVWESVCLADKTLRVIKQNLFWAFFYNCAGIPLAALGFMSPILCAAAMGVSDLVVIGNALRLARFRSAGTTHDVGREEPTKKGKVLSSN